MENKEKFAKSREALHNFMECLKCKKCYKVVENPKRFISCAHFFCARCIPPSVSACSFCGVPVKPNDVQTDFIIQGLLKSSFDLFDLINDCPKPKPPKEVNKENKRILNKREKSNNSIKSNKSVNQRLQDVETRSVGSLGKSTNISSSKESLFTEPDDNVVLSKRMLRNLHKPNAKGEVPLHTACTKNNVPLVRALLNAGADPNTKDNAKLTPLFEVCSYGYYDVCELLLQSGANPNMPGSNNQTALYAAVCSNHIREAELLIKYGAKLDARDDHGKCPEEYCTSGEMRQVLHETEDESEVLSHSNTSLNATILNATFSTVQFVILPMNLDTNDHELLRKVAAQYKMNIVTSFRNAVTHVIVKQTESTLNLSYDICLAILHGKWIVTFDWISLLHLENNIDIDPSIFEVHSINYSSDTPHKARENFQNQNPRLFNNCTFFFALNNLRTYTVGNMELKKEDIIKLATEGEGKILKRMPRPHDIEDEEIVPFHVSEQPDHPLYKCSHFIIYVPDKDEPKVKYNMKNIKALPLPWFFECIEKFQLVDPVNYGL